MPMWTSKVVILISVVALLKAITASPVEGAILSYDKCTAIAVGKDASSTGSPLTTHTADCAECDWRVNKVPARDWPEGSMRPIYLISGTYPRQVREDRGDTWRKANLERNMPQVKDWEALENKTIIGYIPQVPHTYALIEGMYGIMNEHNVAIGESTCAAKLWAAPVSAGGKALLEVSEMSQIALERAKTAREAIQVMGDLAVKYGFYSAEWNVDNPYGEGLVKGEGGEALTVIDPEEAWVFHVIPDDTGASAIWVAQRVPDSHVAVVANSFVIRNVIPDHPDFMYSANLWTVAEKLGWYDARRDGPYLNFVHTYAPKRYRSSYANRRVWRVFTLANQALGLPADTNAYADDYPFSVQVARPEHKNQFTVQDIIDIQRDHYEGTPYSTGYGSMAGGPYGDPNRFDISSTDDMTIWEALQGDFPRTISLFRTSYSFVAEPRRGEVGSWFPRVWFSQYAPDQSTFVPLYVTADKLPKTWVSGAMHKYNSDSAWWNFAAVGNYASRYYVHAMVTVRAVQRRLEAELAAQTDALESRLLTWLKSQPVGSSSSRGQVVQEVTQLTQSLGDYVSATWRDLLPELITTYRDGYIISGQDEVYVSIKKMFYPKWWLEKVGYFAHRGNSEADHDDPNNWIYFSKGPNSQGSLPAAWISLSLLTVLLAGGLGYFLGQHHASSKYKVGASPSSSSSELPADFTARRSSRSMITQQSVSPYRLVSNRDDDDEEEGQRHQERAVFTLKKPASKPAVKSSSKSASRAGSGSKETEMTSVSYQSF